VLVFLLLFGGARASCIDLIHVRVTDTAASGVVLIGGRDEAAAVSAGWQRLSAWIDGPNGRTDGRTDGRSVSFVGVVRSVWGLMNCLLIIGVPGWL